MDALNVDALKQVPQSGYVLTYQQRNITHEVNKYLRSMTFTDVLSGQASDLSIELEDTEGKWRNDWYPGHGDTLGLSIGWSGKPLRELGRFEIDEIGFSSPPSVMTIRALATGIAAAVRTTEHRAYESTTLAAIAAQIAARQGLQLVGNITSIKLDRLTQQESDLTFLAQLSEDFDYAFKVVGQKLVFYSISELMQRPPVATLKLSQLASVDLRDQIKTIPQKIKTKRHDPKKKGLIAYDIVNGKTVAVPSSASKITTSRDTRKRRKRVGSEAEAKARAAADLARRNRERTTGTVMVMGRPELVSGNVVTLQVGGMLDGDYLIQSARHLFTRQGGYETELELQRFRASSISLAPETRS